MSEATESRTGAVVLLAAGRSRRYGADKRQHRLPDGRTLLDHSLALYAGAFDRCFLVLRPDDPEPTPPADLAGSIEIVRAADADQGMGHSLAAGAAAAAPGTYLFVALADMPWVEPATLQVLRAALEQALESSPDVIVQPVHAGRPGHPVGFAGRCRDALATLTGDVGARGVLERFPALRITVAVDDPGVLRDLDRPEDA